MSIVTLYFAGKQLLPLTYAKDNVPFPQTELADRAVVRDFVGSGGSEKVF
jgi:hypothetical protein